MKSVQSVKNSLKFKAEPREGVLSVKIGVKKFSVPVDARLLSDGKYVFLSFPASSELYRVDQKNLSPFKTEEDASDAHSALTPSRKKGRKRGPRGAIEMPSNLMEALSGIPSGHKIGYGPDGKPRLVRIRTRKSKKA